MITASCHGLEVNQDLVLAIFYWVSGSVIVLILAAWCERDAPDADAKKWAHNVKSIAILSAIGAVLVLATPPMCEALRRVV